MVKDTAKISMNVCLDSTFWTAEPFVTWLGFVMHYCELASSWTGVLFRKMIGCLQGQGHNEGFYNQNDYFCHMCWITNPFTTKLGFMADYYIHFLVKRLDCCGQGQGHSEGSELHWTFVKPYFLYHWSLCNESRCVDVLLLKPEWAYTVNSWQQHYNLQYY